MNKVQALEELKAWMEKWNAEVWVTEGVISIDAFDQEILSTDTEYINAELIKDIMDDEDFQS